MEQCKDCETFNQRDECVGDGHEHACCHFVKRVSTNPNLSSMLMMMVKCAAIIMTKMAFKEVLNE